MKKKNANAARGDVFDALEKLKQSFYYPRCGPISFVEAPFLFLSCWYVVSSFSDADFFFALQRRRWRFHSFFPDLFSAAVALS